MRSKPARSPAPVRAAASWVAAVALAALSPAVLAEGLHPTEIHAEVSDGWTDTFIPDGSNPSEGVFNYAAQGYTNPNNDEWNMDWDFNAEPLFDFSSVINANFVVRNTSETETLVFRIRVTMPLIYAGGPDRMFGSAAITVGGGNLPVLATIADTPLWESRIDDQNVAGLFDDPYTLAPEGDSGTADDTAFLVDIHNGAQSSIGIELNFSLTPGTAMTITSNFTVGSSFDPSWFSMDGGGGVSTGGRYRLSATIGQPDPVTMTGGPFTVSGAFWGRFGPFSSGDDPPCPADLDTDGQVGFSDMLAVLAAWGPCAGCPEDMDEDGTVGFGDVLAILSAWGPCDQ